MGARLIYYFYWDEGNSLKISGSKDDNTQAHNAAKSSISNVEFFFLKLKVSYVIRHLLFMSETSVCFYNSPSVWIPIIWEININFEKEMVDFESKSFKIFKNSIFIDA